MAAGVVIGRELPGGSVCIDVEDLPRFEVAFGLKGGCKQLLCCGREHGNQREHSECV